MQRVNQGGVLNHHRLEALSPLALVNRQVILQLKAMGLHQSLPLAAISLEAILVHQVPQELHRRAVLAVHQEDINLEAIQSRHLAKVALLAVKVTAAPSEPL